MKITIVASFSTNYEAIRRTSLAAPARLGIQVADRRKFSWATWATRAAKIKVEESRLTN